MPLILNKSDITEWMNPKTGKERIEQLMMPYTENEMSYHSISTDGGNAHKQRNLPEIKDEVQHPELRNNKNKTLF